MRACHQDCIPSACNSALKLNAHRMYSNTKSTLHTMCLCCLRNALNHVHQNKADSPSSPCTVCNMNICQQCTTYSLKYEVVQHTTSDTRSSAWHSLRTDVYRLSTGSTHECHTVLRTRAGMAAYRAVRLPASYTKCSSSYRLDWVPSVV